jgi:DNA-binding IclR family transcriptional regulator
MLLSHWSRTELDSYLKRTRLTPHTPNTLVSRSKILKELDRISTRGFSVDNEEMEAGVRCVAALVFDHRQQMVAAISISGAAMRITPERIENIGKKVKQCALDISRDLGF